MSETVIVTDEGFRAEDWEHGFAAPETWRRTRR